MALVGGLGLSCLIDADPFLEEATEGSEQSERLKVFLKSYFDYLQVLG